MALHVVISIVECVAVRRVTLAQAGSRTAAQARLLSLGDRATLSGHPVHCLPDQVARPAKLLFHTILTKIKI